MNGPRFKDVNAREVWSLRNLRTLPGTLSRQMAALTARITGRPPAPIRFVIFGQGRSGSSLLVDLLDSHPEVTCEGENYNVNANLFLGPLSMYGFADGRSRRCSTRSYGFKFKPYQLSQQGVTNPSDFLGGFHTRGWKIVHLWRENLVRQVLSNFVRTLRGTAHLRGSQKLEASIFPFHVDLEMFSYLLEGRAQLLREEAAALAGLPHHQICYERDLQEPEARRRSLSGLQDFLGVSQRPLSTDLRRISADDLRGMVKNYDELSEMLRKRGYAHMLD